jgi:hypothetical protein
MAAEAIAAEINRCYPTHALNSGDKSGDLDGQLRIPMAGICKNGKIRRTV